MKNKVIKTVITLEEGSFDGNANQIAINGNLKDTDIGYATEVTYEKCENDEVAGAGQMAMVVYNLPMNIMEQCTTLAFANSGQISVGENKIEVFAGNAGEELVRIFYGDIMQATADFNSAPNIAFNIKAFAGTWDKTEPGRNVSYKKGVSLASIFSELAGNMNKTLEDKGISGSLPSNETFFGSNYKIAHDLAVRYDIGIRIDDEKLVVFPTDYQADSDSIEISAETGLIGYPSFTSNGLHLRCVFNPQIGLQSVVNVKTIVPRAQGLWQVNKITSRLSCFCKGKWETSLDLIQYGG